MKHAHNHQTSNFMSRAEKLVASGYGSITLVPIRDGKDVSWVISAGGREFKSLDDARKFVLTSNKYRQGLERKADNERAKEQTSIVGHVVGAVTTVLTPAIAGPVALPFAGLVGQAAKETTDAILDNVYSY